MTVASCVKIDLFPPKEVPRFTLSAGMPLTPNLVESWSRRGSPKGTANQSPEKDRITREAVNDQIE